MAHGIPLRVMLAAATFAAAALLGSAAGARADVVAHWSFDSLEKGTYPDTSPKGSHPATPENKSQVTQFSGTAPFGNAVALNGKAGSWLNIPPLDFLKGSFTVSVWFNSAVAARNPIFEDWTSPNFSYQFGLEPLTNSQGNKEVGMWGEFRNPEITAAEVKSRKNRRLTSIIKYQAPGPASLNAWHHAAWVYTRTDASHGNLVVYLDGEMTGQQDQQTPPNVPIDIYVTNQTARIGYREFDKRLAEVFNGGIDELWVFNEPLTQDQVKNLMHTNQFGGGSNIVKNPAPANPQVAVAANPGNTNPVVPSVPNNTGPTAVPAVVTPPGDQTPPPAPTAVEPSPTPEVAPTPVPSVARAPVDVSAGITAPLASTPIRGYSATRLAGLATSSLVALTLASYLVWAFSERSKIGRRA